ncbi:MAG: dipeptidase D [Comamonadaceae bacterium]|nr:MAG: dipeptidase D [Comamonadaceae bacterium]
MTSTPTPGIFDALQPAPVWAHFSTLCAMPRPSKGEAALVAHLQHWAQARGLTTLVDSVGNLIVRKPASAGREARPSVVLQSHLDMVCQNNADTPHDFLHDPITPVLRDGWLLAEGTTLGADNGMGVALMLAVLEDTDLVHGPIEALFTVDEEAGMGGAHGLAAGVLQSQLMLNLDTEEWGQFYLGCAGGVDVNVQRAGQPQMRPADQVAGTARNALPREAFATLMLPAEAVTTLADVLAGLQAQLRQELAGVDEGITVSFQPTALEQVMSVADQALWLATLHAAPHGAHRMSVQVSGVVETSNNLGVVDLKPQAGACNFMVRSLVDSAGLEKAREIVSLLALSGVAATLSDPYPGWRPNPGSPLLALCQSVYRSEFGAESSTQVIHAGLECGIIGGKYPELDMVSFGPTIRGAHAPGESVQVQSVAHCWHLLTAILAAID